MLEKAPSHILLITIGTLLALSSITVILFTTEPQQASISVFIFLYVSIFLASLGSFSLLGVGLRKRFKAGIYITHMSVSLRQGALLALLVTSALYLQAVHLLFWWVMASLIVFLLFVEMFLNSK